MSGYRQKIERGFETFVHLIYRWRWVALLLMLFVAAGLSSQLPKLTTATSNESFLHADDPILLAYNDFRDQFGRDEMIIIAIQPPDVFDLKFLKKLKVLHEDIEAKVPHVNEITSLVNARSTRGDGDQLIVEDLLEKWPQSKDDLMVLKQRVLSNPLYLNRIISEDGRFTTIVIQTNSFSGEYNDLDVTSGFDDAEKPSIDSQKGGPVFLTEKENAAVVMSVNKIVNRYQADDFRLYLAGSPVVTTMVKISMKKDMKLFIILSVLTIGLCLFLMFRRLSGVVLPILVVILTLISTLGVMALAGVPVTTVTMVLPSFILAVGVGASVHVLALFYRYLGKTGKKKDSIVHAMGHSGLAIVMTSLTTATGLASFSTAEVASVANLGIFASVGVMLALFYTIILIPALLAIIPIKAKIRPQDHRSLFDRFIDWVTDFSTGHPKAIATVSAVLILISLIAATRLNFSHDVLKWQPDKSPVRIATQKINKELKGSVTLEVILDTGRENGLYDPMILKKLDRLAEEIEQIEMGDLFVGMASSVADILKEIHQALNENRPEFYSIPDNPKLIPQEFLLFENSGSDDLEDVIDSRFQIARFTIKVPWLDALKYAPFLKDIETRFRDAFGKDADITITGLMTLFCRALTAAIHSMGKSYAIAAGVITIMMILLIGSLRIGLISMLPNLAPIIVIMGVMGLFGLPLDMFTMLIGSIAIGMVVDDTVHFMHNFRRYYNETGDVTEAVRRTLHTAGRAMLVTTVVLSLGFFVLMLASMNNVFYFGMLTGITILLALLADFLIAPALMAIFIKPYGRSKL
jgi:predicted RND superfamily exporter protein